jgi:hypothetical protein
MTQASYLCLLINQNIALADLIDRLGPDCSITYALAISKNVVHEAVLRDCADIKCVILWMSYLEENVWKTTGPATANGAINPLPREFYNQVVWDVWDAVAR